MAAITASMVAELRAKTDAPRMECKKALTEAEGNMDKAEELLRVKLGSKAGKAASRITAEGVVASSMHGTTGALVEVNCETDFVTKNDSFLALVQATADLIAQHGTANQACTCGCCPSAAATHGIAQQTACNGSNHRARAAWTGGDRYLLVGAHLLRHGNLLRDRGGRQHAALLLCKCTGRCCGCESQNCQSFHEHLSCL